MNAIPEPDASPVPEAERMRRHLRALSAVNRQLHAQLESRSSRLGGGATPDLLLGGDSADARIDALALRRAASGGEWLEQLQLFGGASDPFLVRSPKRGAYLVEGPLRRQIKAGMLFVALAQILPLRNASESELDKWVEGPPVEVLEGRSGAAFVVVGARRLPLRGLPLPHPVTDDEMLAFPEGEELRIGYVSSPDRGRVGRARKVLRQQGPLRGSITVLGKSAQRVGRKVFPKT
jgi:hypothetical protein